MDLLNLFRLQWDRAVAVIAAVIGLVALLLGYFGTSGTPHVAEQLPYFISGGLFGIFCLTIAAIAWISADLRDEWRELRALRGLLDEELRNRGGDQGLSATRTVAAASPVGYPEPSRNGVPARALASTLASAEAPTAPKRRTRKASTTAAVEQ